MNDFSHWYHRANGIEISAGSPSRRTITLRVAACRQECIEPLCSVYHVKIPQIKLIHMTQIRGPVRVWDPGGHMHFRIPFSVSPTAVRNNYKVGVSDNSSQAVKLAFQQACITYNAISHAVFLGRKSETLCRDFRNLSEFNEERDTSPFSQYSSIWTVPIAW